ncbi:uncharacterized protein LOC123559229 [Mercenaria mercenaria]|uniref:uncharacterized protein LOC123559229 n=1 Tax=Mercenaria mercenaria TaxID=6596 RepID=UPI00234ECB4E|nr:uncharacterized protein LOC123559229 [Mercenaria mercenaria]
MDWIRMVFALGFVFLVIPTNAEFTSNELKMFEDLATYVKSLELKLTQVEKKLENVEIELEGQKEINRKQTNELNAQRIIIDSLRANNNKLKQDVDKIGQQNEITDHVLKQIVQSRDDIEVNENMTKSRAGRNVERDVSDQNTIRVVRQERENIAFSAYLNRDLSNLGPGHTIQYGAAVLNEGNAFNVNTGIFTVPLSGVYLFSFACEDFHNHRIFADILVDGTRKSLVLESPAGDSHAMGTNVVILRLTKGQAVWVAIDASGHDDFLQNTATTFSGVFLYY